jgi:2-C-methyl-D-erythritol 4-phosphate cytidylyltransferase/2-C-methyl-D-erythritol 2,4-cyclodiphosphate synthase
MAGMVAAVVVAAGRGLRAGGDIPKQYRQIFGEPVIRPSLATLVRHAEISAVQPVIHPEDATLFAAAVAGLDLLPPVQGGTTRQASVLSGLEALAERRPEVVLVHDAARPFASPALISRAIAAARQSGAAIPAIPVADTVKTVDMAGTVTGTVDRAQLRMVQTPQAFAFGALLDAHRRAKAAGRDDFTDDAALAEWAGLKVATFQG